MIVVLHGDDEASSYQRLSQIEEEYKDCLKIRLSKNQTVEKLAEAVLTQDLTGTQKIIIAEDFLQPLKKLPHEFLKNIAKGTVVIFWEKTTLSAAKVTGLKKLAKLELFKQKTPLFTFLDSLAPKSKVTFSYLAGLKDTQALSWHLQNRILLLILSKLNITQEDAANITKRNIFDWQWEKIKYQASKFTLVTLISAYNASLRIDFLTKTGKSDLPQNTLISMLLLKYLQ